MSRGKKVELPASVLAKLGTDTDKAVAAAAGVDENAVFRARRAAGIAPFAANKGAKYVWTAENELLLGAMPDTEVGELLGLYQSAVQQARERRGIPPFPHHPEPTPARQLIEAARERAGQTRDEAATAAGMSGDFRAIRWGQYERGERPMSYAMLIGYMRATGQISEETAAERLALLSPRRRRPGQRRDLEERRNRAASDPGTADLPTPTPDAVRAARSAAGHSQAQAAAAVHLGDVARWSEYERGVRTIDAARWELYLLLTGQHPTLRVVPSEPDAG